MLPSPVYVSETSIEQTLAKRRSIRAYRDAPLTLAQVSQLLWAAQGITDAAGHRTAPSAGATYPLEVYLIAGNVEGLAAGIYYYRPAQHDLSLVTSGDLRAELSLAANSQALVKDTAISLLVAAVMERTAAKYHDRAPRYAHIEAGCVAQSVHLQAVALGLGMVVVGAYSDDAVRELVQLPDEEEPLALLPIGYPAV